MYSNYYSYYIPPSPTFSHPLAFRLHLEVASRIHLACDLLLTLHNTPPLPPCLYPTQIFPLIHLMNDPLYD